MRKPITPARMAELELKLKAEFGDSGFYLASSIPELPRVPTGLDDLDVIIGGGLPEGRIIEVFGAPATGKTTLAYHVMQHYPQVLFIDAEGTFDRERAFAFGMNDERLRISKPANAEAALKIMYLAAASGMPLIIVDSIGALTPRAVLENKNFEKQSGVANIARLLSDRLPLVVTEAAATGATILLINQVRVKIGIVFGDPFQSPGGMQLEHLSSLRIQIGRKSYLEDEKVGVYGQISSVRIVKSKVCDPRGKAELPIVFSRGFVTHEELPDVVNELRIAKGFKKKRIREIGEVVANDSVAREEEDEEVVA